jgi:hypothetical protein
MTPSVTPVRLTAPTGLSVQLNPADTMVTWNKAANATGYTLWVQIGAADPVTYTVAHDDVLDPDTYSYTVPSTDSFTCKVLTRGTLPYINSAYSAEVAATR